MGDNIIGIRAKRKPRPLKATYSTESPYFVERVDQDHGGITYEIVDSRPNSYRIVCFVDDDNGGNGYAQHDADQIARGLNLLVQYGKEVLPSVPDRD